MNTRKTVPSPQQQQLTFISHGYVEKVNLIVMLQLGFLLILILGSADTEISHSRFSLQIFLSAFVMQRIISSTLFPERFFEFQKHHFIKIYFSCPPFENFLWNIYAFRIKDYVVRN